MKRRETVGCCFAVGLLLVLVAGVVLSPAGDRTMIAEVVSTGNPPASATVTDVTDLPEAAQAVVLNAHRDGPQLLSTYDDYEAVQTLRGERYVSVDGRVSLIRTTSADGSGGLFEAIVRDLGLATGGLLIGTGVVLADRGRRLAALAALPGAAVLAVLAANAIAAPRLSVVRWLGNTAFALAAAVPVLFGLATRRQRTRYGVATLTVLALSVAVLLTGTALSALYLLVPLIVFAVPGVGFGRVIAGRVAVE